MADPVVRSTWIGTVVFTATAVAAVATEALRAVAVAVALALFAVGTAAMLWALSRAAARSRTEQVTVPGLFFLQDSAPASVRRHVLGATLVQTAVAFATAGVRPFTSLAFGVLVPVYGLGMAAVWGARHGRFGPRHR